MLVGQILLPPPEAGEGASHLPVPVTLETPQASIVHPSTERPLAETLSEALEFAYRALGPDLGYPREPLRVHIYSTSEEMVAGVTRTLGFDRRQAELLAKIGVTPVTRHTFHVHARTRSWGLSLWHAVVHEYVHGLTEDRYGLRPAAFATWVYEGLGEYAAHHALKVKFPDFEAARSQQRLKVAFKALILWRWLPLRTISTEEQWWANIERSRELWDRQYAQAYAAVTYLVERYGRGKFTELLEEVEAGRSLEEAVKTALGTPLAEFETSLQRFLIRKAVLDLYPAYTVGAVVLGVMTLAAILLVRWFRKLTALPQGH